MINPIYGISPYFVHKFATVNLIPVQSDAEFWLTGKVTQVGETYYAISAKNSYVFPLSAAPDWDTTLNLFPFKTPVTISAPANGTDAATAIQAIDVNHFWYAADGTANVIPFTSLFSDIDYEHKCFAQVVAQTLFGNLTEKMPAGIKNVTLYRTVKADADLTTCNTYFNVPVEATSNVYWVDAAFGGTSTGTKAAPFKTLMAAEAATSGKTIYVRTGTFVESHYFVKANAWIATGLTRLQTSANTYAIWNSGVAATSLQGFIVDGTTKANCLRLFSTSVNKTFDRCYFVNSVTNNLLNECSVNDTQVVFSNSVILSTSTNFMTTNQGFKLQGCYINYTKAGGDGLTLTSTATGTADFLYCKFAGTAARYLYLATANKMNVNFHYNEGNITVTTYFLAILAQKQVSIKENLLSATITPILVSPSVDYPIYISNNRVTNSGLSGYCIAVGGEATSIYNDICTNLIIENNSCFGKISIDSSDAVINAITTHGIFVGHQKNAIIRYNRDEGCRIGLIKKHTNVADTSGGIYGNLSIDSIECIYVKGQKDVKIYNNTCVNTILTAATQGFKALRIGANGGANYASGCDVQNNIFVNTLANKTSCSLVFADEAQSTFTSNNNTLHSADKLAQIGATTYADLAAWQVTGHDANSIATNPNLSAYLVPDVPVSGVDLGASYINGLGVLSDFGSATKVPVVVTQAQGATWQQGAFVQ